MLRLITVIGVTIAAVGLGYYFEFEGILPSWRSDSENCHSAFPNAVQHLSTKSPYLFNEPVSVHKPNGCTAEQVWMIVRHGTRNPSEELITQMKVHLPELRDQILKNHKDGRGNLCEKDLTYLNSVRAAADSDLRESEEKYLVAQGQVELIGIANRYKQRFPTIFNQEYRNETFKFKYTKTQRAEASANAFATTLFGKEKHREVWYPPGTKADPVLRFYKGCPKWIHHVDKNPEAYQEQRNFEATEEFNATLKAVSKRLGYESTLTFKDVELMYLACSFETAWNAGKLSPWCGAFTEDDLKVLEYHQDIEYYWIDGYGYELTYKQACPPIQDVVSNFASKINDSEGTPSLVSYFTHSGTSLKLLARLGLFQDKEPLRGDNFKSQANRKWRTSQIDKFATNIAIVLYKCPENEYKVGALFQEKEIALNACNGKLYCSFDEFQTGMNHITSDCDLATLCKLPDKSNSEV